jgi:hypothetical protein
MKGYPKSRFEIVNQTQIQEISTTAVSRPTAIMMCPYTSDKGTEDWELLYGLTDFTDRKGSISFVKHGQAQLSVAEALRSGAFVLAKRMVSDDAALANVTIKARVVKADDVSYVYFYTSSAVNIETFDEACESGYGKFDPDAEVGDAGLDVPLFTVTPMGRGVSNIFIRINPEYITSKSTSYIKYSFEVYEGVDLIESIIFTMNPDIIVDNVAYAMNPKIKSGSNQVRVQLYEDGLYKLVSALAETATDGSESIPVSTLINMDFINALDRKGTTAIAGIVTKAPTGGDGSDAWTTNKPADITTAYDLSAAPGVPLANGTFGAMGVSPVANATEYEKMLLGAFGANTTSTLFDPIIYDLDAYKVDFIPDCNWPLSVKKAVTDLVDFRGDLVFLADFGTTKNTLTDIKEYAQNMQNSKYVAMYHNYCKILNPYTKKEITVTMPYLLISRLVNHISGGVGRAFAGIANEIYFPEIVEGSVNFLPVEIPGQDQKQELVDYNINYISYYDGTPVMETMYTNDDEYTQLSFLHNVMAVQEIIKVIRTRCPRTRYTFLDGDDLDTYLEDVEKLVAQYSTNFKSISVQYMEDEKYESNNIFYAVLKVQFKNFIQEEYFKIIAIS